MDVECIKCKFGNGVVGQYIIFNIQGFYMYIVRICMRLCKIILGGQYNIKGGRLKVLYMCIFEIRLFSR